MSLLCECINGVIQGGILEGVEVDQEGDEIASLCVTKLRSMIVVDGDPNRSYLLEYFQTRTYRCKLNLLHSSPSLE